METGKYERAIALDGANSALQFEDTYMSLAVYSGRL